MIYFVMPKVDRKFGYLARSVDLIDALHFFSNERIKIISLRNGNLKRLLNILHILSRVGASDSVVISTRLPYFVELLFFLFCRTKKIFLGPYLIAFPQKKCFEKAEYEAMTLEGLGWQKKLYIYVCRTFRLEQLYFMVLKWSGVRLLAMCEFSRAMIVDLGFPHDKISIFPLICLPRNMPGLVEDKRDGRAKSVHICFSGVLSVHKGFPVFIELANRLISLAQERDITVRISVFGSGPCKDWIEKLIVPPMHLGKLDRNSFKQALSDVDVSVVPSYAEQLPVVALESLQRGCLTVVRDLDCYSDLVGFENLMVTDFASPIALAEDILKKAEILPKKGSLITEAERKMSAEVGCSNFLELVC